MDVPIQESEKKAPELGTRILAFFEIFLVAVAGDLLAVPIVLKLSGVPASAVFEDSSVLFGVLVLKATVTLLSIVLLLRLHGESLRTLGWRIRAIPGETWRGLAYVPALFVAIAAGGLFFQFFLPDYVTEENPLLEMIQRPQDVVIFLVSSIYVGGVQEEVQRAFILTRFKQYLGGPVLGLILWSACFGLGHAVQGIDNAVKAGILGLLFGLLYLRRKDMTAPIVAHAIFDIVTVLVFWFFVQS